MKSTKEEFAKYWINWYHNMTPEKKKEFNQHRYQRDREQYAARSRRKSKKRKAAGELEYQSWTVGN